MVAAKQRLIDELWARYTAGEYVDDVAFDDLMERYEQQLFDTFTAGYNAPLFTNTVGGERLTVSLWCNRHAEDIWTYRSASFLAATTMIPVGECMADHCAPGVTHAMAADAVVLMSCAVVAEMVALHVASISLRNFSLAQLALTVFVVETSRPVLCDVGVNSLSGEFTCHTRGHQTGRQPREQCAECTLGQGVLLLRAHAANRAHLRSVSLTSFFSWCISPECRSMRCSRSCTARTWPSFRRVASGRRTR